MIEKIIKQEKEYIKAQLLNNIGIRLIAMNIQQKYKSNYTISTKELYNAIVKNSKSLLN